MEENKEQGLQLELNPEVAQGKYVNLALISHSLSLIHISEPTRPY